MYVVFDYTLNACVTDGGRAIFREPLYNISERTISGYPGDDEERSINNHCGPSKNMFTFRTHLKFYLQL